MGPTSSVKSSSGTKKEGATNTGTKGIKNEDPKEVEKISPSNQYTLKYVDHKDEKEFQFFNAVIDDSSRMCIDHFKIHKVIGRGTFGKVMLVQHNEDGRFFALKILKKSEIYKKKQVIHTIAERTIQAKMEHPFIVCLRYAFQTPDKLYMLFDYINGGELFHHLAITKVFTEDRAKFYFAQIFLALEFLHSNSIIYRDLKPENILLTPRGDIKLTDFGLAKELSREQEGEIGNMGNEFESKIEEKKAQTSTFCGTKEYLAPEVILGKEYGVSVDYWALGILLFEMLTGDTPFVSPTGNQLEIYQYIIYSEPDLSSPNLSEHAKDLLTRMLYKKVQNRITTSEIKQHPFFYDINWEKILSMEILAPYRVNISGPDSTTYISKEFTEQMIKDTPATAASNVANLFTNFSYIPDSIPDSIEINHIK